MITLGKDITLSLKEPNNCLLISQRPKNGVIEAKLDLKIVKCSQPQSTICIRQKNDPVDVITAPPPPRFPCQPKANEKRTSDRTRRKRNVRGTLTQNSKMNLNAAYHIAYLRVMNRVRLWYMFQVNLRTPDWIAGKNVTISKELVNGVAQWAFVALKRRTGMTLPMVAMEPLVAKLSMNVS